MAIDMTFNSIIHEIQLSKLNFAVHLTPYAAYITLKKSTQVDLNGVPASPSPPVCALLEQSYKDQLAAKEEIISLRSAVTESHNACKELEASNSALILKLNEAEEDRASLHNANENLLQKLDFKESEVMKLKDNINKSDNNLKVTKEKHIILGHTKKCPGRPGTPGNARGLQEKMVTVTTLSRWSTRLH